jgi:hypothetical protein
MGAGETLKRLHLIGEGRAAFDCPGCKFKHVVIIPPHPNAWQFNGDFVYPTLQPSVLMTRHEWHPPVNPENLAQWKAKPWTQTRVELRCHSYVTNGGIQFLDDCSHELRGKTVDLPVSE